MNKRIVTNIFIAITLGGAYTVGYFEKYIDSRNWDVTPYISDPLFKDDIRSTRNIRFWPFSRFAVFSDPYGKNNNVNRVEARGVTESGEEVILNIAKTFYPLWENGLHRGLKRSIIRGYDPKKVLDSLGGLYYRRFMKYAWQNNPEMRERYPRITKINWYIQLWKFGEWVDFRKEHEHFSDWFDFKKYPQKPIYHNLYHTSVVRP